MTTDARPQLVVHSLAQAVTALEAAAELGVPVTLVSAPGAARTGGAGWWRELVAQARATVPAADADAILDCADEAGRALAAIREGVEAIAVDLPVDPATRLAEIAAATGCGIGTIRWVCAFDFARTEGPREACLAWLRAVSGAVANRDRVG